MPAGADIFYSVISMGCSEMWGGSGKKCRFAMIKVEKSAGKPCWEEARQGDVGNKGQNQPNILNFIPE